MSSFSYCCAILAGGALSLCASIVAWYIVLGEVEAMDREMRLYSDREKSEDSLSEIPVPFSGIKTRGRNLC